MTRLSDRKIRGSRSVSMLIRSRPSHSSSSSMKTRETSSSVVTGIEVIELIGQIVEGLDLVKVDVAGAPRRSTAPQGYRATHVNLLLVPAGKEQPIVALLRGAAATLTYCAAGGPLPARMGPRTSIGGCAQPAATVWLHVRSDAPKASPVFAARGRSFATPSASVSPPASTGFLSAPSPCRQASASFRRARFPC